MLKISSEQKKTQDVCRPADHPDLLVYEPHYGLRYVLEQVYTFHQSCEVLGLPVSDPFAFLQALVDMLRPENRDVFQVEGKTENPMEYQPLFISLLLVYACYGDLLFCTGHPVKEDFPKTVQVLLHASPVQMQTCLDMSRMRGTLREMVQLSQRHKIYGLFPELQYLEEMHRNLFVLSCKTSVTIEIKHQTDVPEQFATQLFDIFLKFYKQQKSIVDDNLRKENMPSIQAQRTRLKGLFELREQAIEFAELAAGGKLLGVEVLKQHAEKLVDWLNKQRAEVPPAMDKFRRVLLSCETEEPKISERMRSEKAQLAGLVQLQYDQFSFHGQALELLQSRLQQLLNSYQDDCLYRFFNQIFQFWCRKPLLQQLAPTYVWRLFVRYQTPLFKGSNKLFGGANPVDFSAEAMLSDWNSDLRSEERTSITHAQQDLDLYNDLAAYFTRVKSYFPVNLPMCEHLLQRILLTQTAIESDTSIFGTPLKRAKPLFRSFALIHGALERMGCDLWKQMPCKDTPAVTLEEADAFYQDTRPRCQQTIVMSYLLERTNGLPDSRKKNLTLSDCQEVTRLLMQSCCAAAPSDAAAQELLAWLDQYISERDVLRQYAEQSKDNGEKVRYAICRLAVERTAHALSRETLQTCAELFYQRIGIMDLQKMWGTFFAERPESRWWKTADDCISLGDVRFSSRCWRRFSVDRFAEAERMQSSSAIVLTGTAEQAMQVFRENAEKIGASPVLYQYDGELSVDQEDFSEVQSTIQCLCQTGFTGIVLPITLCVLPVVSANEQIDDEIKRLARKYKRIFAFLRQEKDALPERFLLIAKFAISNISEAEQNCARLLTRWCIDDGADAVLLTPAFPIDELAIQMLWGIAESQPAPVLLSLPASQDGLADALLRMMEIHAVILMDEPQIAE